jgi:hypothetical protein
MISVDILRNYNPGLVRTLHEEITHLCVASYDGDIVNDNMVLEPMVEFVGAKNVSDASSELTHAKHPSILHLECFFDGKPAVMELHASIRLAISKHNIIPAMQPDKNFSLDEKAKVILQNWLCSRYRREALPRPFVERTMGLWNYMESEGRKYAANIMGYWLDYDPREEVDDDVPYVFSLFIVYSIRHHDAQDQAEKLALEIRNHFPEWREDLKRDKSRDIELGECRACGEDCFTLFDLQNCVQVDLDQVKFLIDQDAEERAEQEAREQKGSVTLI